MKSLALIIVGFSLVSLSAAAQKNQTFSGEIMDSACAKSGSHEGMMKSNPDMKRAKDCTVACVRHGATYVLYDAATKTTYLLDDQKQPEQFAGTNVVVTGTANEATKTIHVAMIKAVS